MGGVWEFSLLFFVCNYIMSLMAIRFLLFISCDSFSFLSFFFSLVHVDLRALLLFIRDFCT